MSFVDTLWGFEVTGGYDQYEPLTVLEVKCVKYVRRTLMLGVKCLTYK